MKQAIKSKLRGAVEFMLFMPGAEKPFRGTTFKDMLSSFLIPLMLLPYGIWGMSLVHGTELADLSKLPGINQFSTTAFILISIIKGILITVFLISVMYYFAKLMERTEYFYDLIAAGNWILIPNLVPSIVILIMILSGGQDWMGVYMVATLNILYGIAVSAFSTTRLLNIPWELGVTCAIFGLAIGEIANKIVNQIGLNYFG